ncbi:uncharacterized protein LOC129245469 [Anastrepha obliqua]|uniref:uncharacterized protein LOC129245469 n=1 Tax=Anastrepha obliqua TaxID=95512 RepID=UPI00240A2436|nr:uncharacterized protein LOC129245469 [Anastrepha obliqua]
MSEDVCNMSTDWENLLDIENKNGRVKHSAEKTPWNSAQITEPKRMPENDDGKIHPFDAKKYPLAEKLYAVLKPFTYNASKLLAIKGTKTLSPLKIIARKCVLSKTSTNPNADSKAVVTSVKILPQNISSVLAASDNNHYMAAGEANSLTIPTINKEDLPIPPDPNTYNLDNVPTLLRVEKRKRKENDFHASASKRAKGTATTAKRIVKADKIHDNIKNQLDPESDTAQCQGENDGSKRLKAGAESIDNQADIESDLVTNAVFNKSSCDSNVVGRHQFTQTEDSATKMLSTLWVLREKVKRQAEEILSLKAAMKLFDTENVIKKFN